jgi:hypothetical protein
MKKLFEHTESVSIKAYDRIHIFTIPYIKKLSGVYFLFLSLQNKAQVISRNCYWLTTTKDVFDAKTKEWFHWSLKQHADMSPLRTLPKAELDISYDIKEKKQEYVVTVTIKNISDTIASFLWAKVINKANKDIFAPVYWDDNCTTLLPSQQQIITGRFPKTIKSKDIEVIIEGL